jgi:hypothetical protein
MQQGIALRLRCFKKKIFTRERFITTANRTRIAFVKYGLPLRFDRVGMSTSCHSPLPVVHEKAIAV